MRKRSGANPCLRQIIRTVDQATPTRFDIARSVQCPASPRGGEYVRFRTSRTLPAPAAFPGGRLTFRPATSCSGRRSCQHRIVGFDTPTRRVICVVPQPSALAGMICARRTCFSFKLASSTIASSRRRSSSSIQICALSPMAGCARQSCENCAYADFRPCRCLETPSTVPRRFDSAS